jgi:hypothetical protein
VNFFALHRSALRFMVGGTYLHMLSPQKSQWCCWSPLTA